MVLMLGSFFKYNKVINKKMRPNVERKTNSCQTETRGIIDLAIKSPAVTLMMPSKSMKIPKPILSGFIDWEFNGVIRENRAQSVPLEKTVIHSSVV